MPTTAERLATLEQMLGIKYLGMSSDQLEGELKPENELHGGRYPYILSDYQIRAKAIDPFFGENGILVGIQQALATTPTPAPSQSVDVGAVIAKLATDYNVHFAAEKIGIGMVPDPNAGAQLQLCGDRGASILGRANTLGTDGQNPGEVHTNEIHVVDNDGGLRFLQYGFWGKNGFKRNTTNRAFSVVALDSEGDICQSKVAVGADKDGGQLWYIITNFNEKIVQFCTFQTGWQIEIRETVSGYSDRLRKRL